MSGAVHQAGRPQHLLRLVGARPARVLGFRSCFTDKGWQGYGWAPVVVAVQEQALGWV